MRRYSVLLLAMAYGSTVALLVVAVGFVSLVRNGVTPEAPQLQMQRAGAADSHDAAGHDAHSHDAAGHDAHSHDDGANQAGAQPDIRIEARHVGNLVLDIKAEVTMNQDGDPLSGAKVVAFTDMAQMPNAHALGPLPLQAAPGKPGLYETAADLSMPGDYEVRVVVTEPVAGERTTTVRVDTATVDGSYGGHGRGP